MGWLTLLRLSVTVCGSGPALSRLSRNSLGIPSSLRTPRTSYIPTTWACARARARRGAWAWLRGLGARPMATRNTVFTLRVVGYLTTS